MQLVDIIDDEFQNSKNQKFYQIILSIYLIMTALSYIFWMKIKEEMRIEIIAEKKPKSKLRLNPKDPSDLNIQLQNVKAWSIDNEALYTLLLQNGFAEFFCNKQYLYEHYTYLYLINAKITQIDVDTIKLKNVKYLKLNSNKISVIQNLPENCIELYLYSNVISDIKLKSPTKISYLGLGNNYFTQQNLDKIPKFFPQLRCLDIYHNNLCKIENTLSTLKRLNFLRVLSLYGNPISLLKHYYKVVTKQLLLTYFDQEKYVKQEKKVIKKIVVPVQEKKQEKKDTKKDNKKDVKKQAKKQQEIPPVVEIIEVEEKIKNIDASTFHINISVFENIKGVLLDSTLYPDFSKKPEKFQTSFWIEYHNGKELINTQQKRVLYQTAAIEEDKGRITFNQTIQYQFNPTIEFRNYISRGLIIKIFREEPILKPDLQTEQKKPQIKDGFPITKKEVFGILKINMSEFYKQSKKIINKYRVFPEVAESSIQFYYADQNEDKMIDKNKKKIDQLIKKQEEQLKKQLELDEAAKIQKKGGKDTKKPVVNDKKATKKTGKDEIEIKSVPTTDYPISKRQYIYIDDSNIIRSLNSLLSVSLQIK